MTSADQLRDSDQLRLRGITTLEQRGVAGHDVTPGHDQLHHYWVAGEGLAKWKTWRELVAHLVRHVGPIKAKTYASAWFHERYGFWPGDDKNRVMNGKPPRGHRIGPG